jgi:predicted transcriptional regulator
MIIKDIVNILDAEIICGHEHITREVKTACGADMMSDVLAFVKDQSILLTGLVNTQVVRTADMMDMVCIVFVRGKRPDEDMIKLAQERGIVLACTSNRMFSACGILWENGLCGGR